MQILRKRDKCPVSLYFGNLGSSHLIGNLKLGYNYVVNWKIRAYNTWICTGRDAWKVVPTILWWFDDDLPWCNPFQKITKKHIQDIQNRVRLKRFNSWKQRMRSCRFCWITWICDIWVNNKINSLASKLLGQFSESSTCHLNLQPVSLVIWSCFGKENIDRPSKL